MGFQGADPALNRFYLRDPMKMTKKVAQKATSAALDVAKQTADVSMAAARQAQKTAKQAADATTDIAKKTADATMDVANKVIPPIGAEGLDRRGPPGSCRLFLGPGFRLAAHWNRLGEAVKMRKKLEKTGKKWARYGLRSVKDES